MAEDAIEQARATDEAKIAALEQENAYLRNKLDDERSAMPGRYAFYHRHLAIGYARQVAPKLVNEAMVWAGHRIRDEGGRTYADMIGEQALALEHAADRADALNDRNQELAEEHKALLDALAAMVECHCFTTVVGRYDSARSADEAAMDLLVKAGRMERASGGYRFCEKATDA